jgi:nucleotide-binding universal stress UspA family protein
VPRTIVLGYDATDGAQAALEKAIELAQLIQARIVIVFGYEIPAAYGGETGEYRRAVRAIGETAVADAAKRIQQAGLDCDSELVPTRPAEGLVSVAEQAGASMIVVGTHGEHPLTGAILGSVPHKLLHISPIPVLVVPEPA